MDNNHTIPSNSSSAYCVLPHDITDNQWAFYKSYVWWVEGFGSLLTGGSGILFNIITIRVLLGSELVYLEEMGQECNSLFLRIFGFSYQIMNKGKFDYAQH